MPVRPPLSDGPMHIRVVSYNVRFVDLLERDPREHAAGVSTILHLLDADVVGLQEAYSTSGMEYVKPCPFRAALSGALPHYGWIAPYGAAVQSQSNAILYRADRFFPLAQGVEWLSPEPERPDSVGWGNRMPRYLVWVRFYDAESRLEFAVINVHLDHISRRANAVALDRIRSLIDSEFRDVPLVLTGDLNEPPVSPARVRLEQQIVSVLGPMDGPTRVGVPTLQIDAIHASSHFAIEHAGVARGDLALDRRLMSATSDHRPVVADLLHSGLYSAGHE